MDEAMQNVIEEFLEQDDNLFYSPVALQYTTSDIEQFKAGLANLQAMDIETSLFMKCMHSSLQLLKRMVDERDFVMFFNHYIKGKTHEVLAHELDTSQSTITRHCRAVLKKLSIILYPDLTLQKVFFNV
ncbi:sigma-70 family RNA polymerase sigma factor [Sporomusa sphaeroides]|uniref:RNA polymerase sigma factor 70 region 4 type 2 domain-containing protein n=1 Tax=Sporomusa sphaeroides DSM 2875 TaxID=1337886 RepID=A0ABM9W1X9_9FIRM|nr:sigma-70 family RNA polymerase sigma factor [Sporomusa sphaeroides]OLS56158.1 hypothetical protein SPSPH_25470 [Sporomusa sphaeroides DSM 2875]CVK19200.1 hypothetical protein SSPH_01849 [Sporomusa sphaeroides DSM 2875]